MTLKNKEAQLITSVHQGQAIAEEPSTDTSLELGDPSDISLWEMDFGDLETELTEVNVEPEITGEYIPEPFENTKRSQIEAVLQVVQEETPVFTAPMLGERSRRGTLFTPSRSAQVMPDRNEESVLVRMYSPTRRWRQYLKDTKDPTAEKLKDDERKELKLFLRAICLKCSSDCTTWMLQKSVFMAHSHPPRCLL